MYWLIFFRRRYREMRQGDFGSEVNSCGNNIDKLEQLEEEKIKGYQRSNTVRAEFEMVYAGFMAENALIDSDNLKRKDLFLNRKLGRILLLGLENAGKNTLLNTLKSNSLGQYGTFSSNCKELIMGNITFQAFDLGHGDRVWKDHFPIVDAIVFVIDATNRYGFFKAKAELDTVLVDEQVAYAPILILGSKSDLQGAITEEELHEVLGISSKRSEKSTGGRIDINSRPMALFICNMTKQETFGQGFRWLSNYLKNI